MTFQTQKSELSFLRPTTKGLIYAYEQADRFRFPQFSTRELNPSDDRVIGSAVPPLERGIQYQSYAIRLQYFIGESYEKLNIKNLDSENPNWGKIWLRMEKFMLNMTESFDPTYTQIDFPLISYSDDGIDLYWKSDDSGLLINFPLDDDTITFFGKKGSREEFSGSFDEIPPYIASAIVEWLKKEWNGE